MGHGNRQVLQDLMMPFKAVIDLGGVRGVMMYGQSTLYLLASHTGLISHGMQGLQ